MFAMKKIFSILIGFSALASAQLQFEQPNQELRAKPDDSLLTCDFAFENKGTTVQEILTYIPNCTCISVQISNDGKLVYQPGEKGILRATFELGNLAGSVAKQVVISMKGDPVDQPSITLNAKIDIPELVKLEPKTIEWLLDEPKTAKIIKVRMDDDKPIHISGVTSSNANFEVTHKEVVAGKEYEISVVPAANAQNTPGIGVIRVETDCPVSKQKNQMAFAVIRSAPAPIPEAVRPK
jgi:Protein of unknown function (DUF1573)